MAFYQNYQVSSNPPYLQVCDSPQAPPCFEASFNPLLCALFLAVYFCQILGKHNKWVLMYRSTSMAYRHIFFLFRVCPQKKRVLMNQQFGKANFINNSQRDNLLLFSVIRIWHFLYKVNIKTFRNLIMNMYIFSPMAI